MARAPSSGTGSRPRTTSACVERRSVAGSRPMASQACVISAFLCGEELRRAPDVPLVGLPGDDPGHDLLPRAADQQRHRPDRLGLHAGVPQLVVLAVEGRDPLVAERPDDLARLLEPAQPRTRGEQVDAVLGVLVLLPPGAEAEDEAAVADDVDGGGLVGQDGGVAVEVAGHQRPQPDPGHDRRQRGEDREPLEDVTAALGGVVHEVVHRPRPRGSRATPRGGRGPGRPARGGRRSARHSAAYPHPAATPANGRTRPDPSRREANFCCQTTRMATEVGLSAGNLRERRRCLGRWWRRSAGPAPRRRTAGRPSPRPAPRPGPRTPSPGCGVRPGPAGTRSR